MSKKYTEEDFDKIPIKAYKKRNIPYGGNTLEYHRVYYKTVQRYYRWIKRQEIKETQAVK